MMIGFYDPICMDCRSSGEHKKKIQEKHLFHKRDKFISLLLEEIILFIKGQVHLLIIA